MLNSTKNKKQEVKSRFLSEKKQLLKKFYACLPVGMAFIVPIAIGSMMFSVSANAQIVYTDVIPDASITCSAPWCTQSYNLDLNNDGSMDFILTFNRTLFGPCGSVYQENLKVSVSTTGANSFYGIVSSNPSALNYGTIIDSNLIWSNGADTLKYSGYLTCFTTTTSGNWNSTADRYLPVKISINSDNYFGWIRMQIPYYPDTIKLKDYAYNSIPNQSILAGQTVATGVIENSFASSVNIFPNPATNHLTIALGSNNKKVEVTIADITGKVIYKNTATDIQKIGLNTQDFAEGIYAVQIQVADFIATKKLIITK